MALLDLVSDASGYHPVQPGDVAKAIDQVKAWRKSGIDFDTIVLPAIRDVIANSTDPTSSLKRFDKRIRHEAARHRGAKTNGTEPPRPPAEPILKPPGEDPLFQPVRADLLERMGAPLYANLLNDVRFEVAEQGDRRNLAVKGRDYMIETVVHGRNAPLIRQVARQHGFDGLWKGHG